MKIIHCGDLHLDSKMETNLSPEKSRIRNNEILRNFGKMVDFARDNGVKIIMIAGDMFDSERASASTVEYVFDRMCSVPEIDFLYLKGNHDEEENIFSGRSLPNNLKRFSDSWQFYDYGELSIGGVQWSGDNYESIYDSLKLDKDKKNIILMHGQTSTQPGYELVCLPRLKNKHIDYLALGHIHSYKLEKLDDEGVYAYCGCFEGRGFDECGKKGFVLLDTDKDSIKPRFVPFATRYIYDIEVDITGLDTVSEMLRAIKEASADISRESLVKFTLTGFYEAQTNKDLAFLSRSLQNEFFHVKIKDKSRLKVEPQSYENDISLKGEFIRLVMGSALSQEDKDRIILAGLRALQGEEIDL